MALADDIVSWIESQSPALVDADDVAVVAHRRPDDFGAKDVLIVSLERSRDSHLFGRGLGLGNRGESEIRLGLWWVVNTRLPAAQRTPQRAFDGLQPVYDALVGTRRETIGSVVVRHVASGLAPVLRSTAAPDEIVVYARVSLDVQGLP